jgi:hypothetical protein
VRARVIRVGPFGPDPDRAGVGHVVHATLHGNQFHRVAKPVKRVIVH